MRGKNFFPVRRMHQAHKRSKFVNKEDLFKCFPSLWFRIAIVALAIFETLPEMGESPQVQWQSPLFFLSHYFPFKMHLSLILFFAGITNKCDLAHVSSILYTFLCLSGSRKKLSFSTDIGTVDTHLGNFDEYSEHHASNVKSQNRTQIYLLKDFLKHLLGGKIGPCPSLHLSTCSLFVHGVVVCCVCTSKTSAFEFRHGPKNKHNFSPTPKGRKLNKK